MLLPEPGTPAALVVAERLRQTLNEHVRINSIDSAERIIPMSVSIGVAVANAGESISELLNRADHALYEAKAAGRNRVSLAAAVLV